MLPDESREPRATSLRKRYVAGGIAVFTGVQGVQIEGDGERLGIGHLGDYCKASPDADRRAGQAVSVAAKTCAIILAMRPAPHHGKPQHLRRHPVAIVDDRQPRGFLE